MTLKAALIHCNPALKRMPGKLTLLLKTALLTSE